MRDREFFERVAEQVEGRDLDVVEEATRVTLRSLAIQLDDRCRGELAARLPDGLAADVQTAQGVEPQDGRPLGTLLERLDERVPGGVDREAACRAAHAVFATLREVLPARSYMLTVEHLPDEYGEVIA